MGSSVTHMNLTLSQWTMDLVDAYKSNRVELGENDITSTIFAALSGCSDNSARLFLAKQVKEGKMTRKKMVTDGHCSWVYTKIL